jgi:polyisoprenoid-binding protein YceI
MKSIWIAAAAASAILAQAAPAQLPPGVFAGEKDSAAATAGKYDLDASHTAVIAKVSHIGYSLSVFRFDKVSGTLTWDAAKPEASALSIEVATASIATPVPGFAAELGGKGFLNPQAYPTATFVSTAFHKVDATHGKVDGQFTLLGKTKPLTFNVELLGAGKGFMGKPRLGVEATANINPADFGLPAMFAAPIILVIDAEFAHQ